MKKDGKETQFISDSYIDDNLYNGGLGILLPLADDPRLTEEQAFVIFKWAVSPRAYAYKKDSSFSKGCIRGAEYMDKVEEPDWRPEILVEKLRNRFVERRNHEWTLYLESLWASQIEARDSKGSLKYNTDLLHPDFLACYLMRSPFCRPELLMDLTRRIQFLRELEEVFLAPSMTPAICNQALIFLGRGYSLQFYQALLRQAKNGQNMDVNFWQRLSVSGLAQIVRETNSNQIIDLFIEHMPEDLLKSVLAEILKESPQSVCRYLEARERPLPNFVMGIFLNSRDKSVRLKALGTVAKRKIPSGAR